MKELSGQTKKCKCPMDWCQCDNEMPIERVADYCMECEKHIPPTRFLTVGFGTKGNGAHVVREQDFQGETKYGGRK